MTAVAFLMAHPEIPHGTLRIAFTPDEEIGQGTRHFDVARFGDDSSVVYPRIGMDARSFAPTTQKGIYKGLDTFQLSGRVKETINEFRARRDLARLGQPVVQDLFADPGATLPIVINAAYEPSRNGIEIPAAFMQPPIYDPKADAAVNFCALGAVIGHEITHGFDSQGRLYDADGNVRDWWAPQDVKRFNAQADKLVAQANAFQVLPGLHANGALAVGENLADLGGVSLAYAALRAHLHESPKENVKIDGLSPDQRCFIAWAQVWADKAHEGWLRQVTANDPHPPGRYRASAPARHERGFNKSFGIRKGDPMWLDPKDRVTLW